MEFREKWVNKKLGRHGSVILLDLGKAIQQSTWTLGRLGEFSDVQYTHSIRD